MSSAVSATWASNSKSVLAFKAYYWLEVGKYASPPPPACASPASQISFSMCARARRHRRLFWHSGCSELGFEQGNRRSQLPVSLVLAVAFIGPASGTCALVLKLFTRKCMTHSSSVTNCRSL